jgi:hypothetical protein
MDLRASKLTRHRWVAEPLGGHTMPVRYAVYDLPHAGKLTEWQHSQSWANFLADLESEIECPQPDRSND